MRNEPNWQRSVRQRGAAWEQQSQSADGRKPPSWLLNRQNAQKSQQYWTGRGWESENPKFIQNQEEQLYQHNVDNNKKEEYPQQKNYQNYSIKPQSEEKYDQIEQHYEQQRQERPQQFQQQQNSQTFSIQQQNYPQQNIELSPQYKQKNNNKQQQNYQYQQQPQKMTENQQFIQNYEYKQQPNSGYYSTRTIIQEKKPTTLNSTQKIATTTTSYGSKPVQVRLIKYKTKKI